MQGPQDLYRWVGVCVLSYAEFCDKWKRPPPPPEMLSCSAKLCPLPHPSPPLA